MNNTPNPTPGPFQLEVKCNPAIPSATVMLTGPGFQQSIAVSPRAECKFREVAPKAPPGCRWIVTYPDGQSARAGDTKVVQNELDCGAGPSTCPAGQSLVTFPGSNAKYCCDGKPGGSDKFCCTRIRQALPRPGKR